MTLRVVSVAVLWLFGSVTGLALDCKRALSPIETTICHEPDLSRIDAELNGLYSGLRPQLAANGRLQLLAQQRAWLAERNRACGSADVACLRTQYISRVDQLQALKAAAESSEASLKDATPRIIKGSWKAVAVQDPAGPKPVDEDSLTHSLRSAGLPAVGAVVSTAPGKLCVPTQSCRAIGWIRYPLTEIDLGESIARVLKLSRTAGILQGSDGATAAPYYLVLPQKDGSLWAVFALCGPNASDCRNAVEVWRPVSPDAAVLPPI